MHVNDRDAPAPMWQRTTSIRIQASIATVFTVLSEIELWPAVFPHVRSARVLRRDSSRRMVVVQARWRGLPIGWKAIQTVDPVRGHISIRHLSPLTVGSVATFDLTPVAAPGNPDAVDLTFCQNVVMPFGLVGNLLARTFVGGLVARQQGEGLLARLKYVAEGGSLAGGD